MSRSEDKRYEKVVVGASGFWIKTMQSERERTCLMIKPDGV